jgi:hypothetical protein
LALEPQNYNFQKIYSLLSFPILSLIFSLIFRKEKKKNTKKKKSVTSLTFFEIWSSLTAHVFFGFGDRVRYRSLFFSQGRPPGAWLPENLDSTG